MGARMLALAGPTPPPKIHGFWIQLPMRRGHMQLRESTAKHDESRYQRIEAGRCHEVELVNQDTDLTHMARKDYE